MLTEQQKHKFEVTRQMAKEELEALDKEISNELGFGEPTNFIKYFRRHTSSTPLEFREKHRF